MSAVARNIVKFIGGTAIGAGIGALLSKSSQSVAEQGPPADHLAVHESVSVKDRAAGVKQQAQTTVTEKKESLRERWERAQAAGEAAQEAREAELRAYFREKVNDPTAFPPGAPTRTDT